MSAKYDDILHLPYPYPKKRPQMSMTDRAAQFSPFAALTGYDDALIEIGRQTQSKTELTEDVKYGLDLKQKLLIDLISSMPEVTITYFVPDRYKSGGQYVTVTDKLLKIDQHHRYYLLTNNCLIPFDDVRTLDSPLFQNLYL